MYMKSFTYITLHQLLRDLIGDHVFSTRRGRFRLSKRKWSEQARSDLVLVLVGCDVIQTVFEKISKYIGRNVQHLVTRPDEKYCFRLHGNIVYYCSEKLMRQSTNVGTDELLSIGTAVGKLTKTKKFHLRITFLDYLAQYAKYKVWIKPNSEMSFLYGNNVVKSGLGRITEGTPQYAGVVVYSMNDIPLGFGIAAQATELCKDLEPTAYVVLHQADIGEYLRVEDEMF
ncbi:hypothetical protein BBJ28_00004008 [Nothophytophthora sp. Chile5]|nr:hypothetical protein BBJ28_00004008 [Nothophytophthora sp. Chile5]